MQGQEKKTDDVGFYKRNDILRDITLGKILPLGMSRRCVTSGDVMLAMHEAFLNLKTEDHVHDSAQITYVVKGRMAVPINGDKKFMGLGEFAFIPAGVSHHIQTEDEYVMALNIFSSSRKNIIERVAELSK